MSPRNWRLDLAFPWLARLPGSLPWWLAPLVGHLDTAAAEGARHALVTAFGRVFPQSSPQQRHEWAERHLAMQARETLDACAFPRLHAQRGMRITLEGEAHYRAALARGRGVILVLAHYGRLLTAPVALAARGHRLSMVTMPVLDNPDLPPAMRRFLTKKVAAFGRIIGGEWISTDRPLLPVRRNLARGGAWIILADAWSPTFARLRAHPFLGGSLSLPTGIERLAAATGAALIYGATYEESPRHLHVQLRALPENPAEALGAAVAQLETDVRERPWDWWHWGLLEYIWHSEPPSQE